MNKSVFPVSARLPINRCNLPAHILGSLAFQQHPKALYIDGVSTLHHSLFEKLDTLNSPAQRQQYFTDYMAVMFRFDAIEDIGYQADTRVDRRKSNYLNLIKGWMFDASSIEGAVFKSWVESRFGLVTRYHRGWAISPGSDGYQHYIMDRSRGIYNTNAIESQIDLLYTFCQYELTRLYDVDHLVMYRGMNHIEDDDKIHWDKNHRILLLNNINSFTRSIERACEFGDIVLEVRIPLSKLVYIGELLPAALRGESEAIVLGGLYRVQLART